jgi:alpha-L-fucosidase
VNLSKLIISLSFLLSFSLFLSCKGEPADIPPNAVVPTPEQIAYQEMELIGFVHFTVNTFTDKEWGYGDESPDLFIPTALNTDQWAQVAREAGMRQLILTAKHHDGFCLWPSRFTAHSVKNSPWQKGKGDVVKAFVRSCRDNGLNVGLYLSPWDRNHAAYGTPEYLEYYRNQLQELLTSYGKISEIWFDGANGGDGFYGGANESRQIDRTSYYQWDMTWKMVKQLQPYILIFSDAGPDIRWIGNEHGFAGESNWSMLTTDTIVVGAADVGYLNSGDPNGKKWVVGECDVSIRPGWFYHAREDNMVKTPQQLIDIYYKSVGRNGVLLLNIPPDRRGLFHDNDIAALRSFKKILDETFKVNLAQGKTASASNYRFNHAKFSPMNILDHDKESYWAAEDGVLRASLTIDLGREEIFDRIELQEPIRFGQRIARFTVEGEIDNTWKQIADGTTIGYKRLLRIDPLRSQRVRLNILEAHDVPALSNFGLYKASEKE